MLALSMSSVAYTRPCSLHTYSTWACIGWFLDDTRPVAFFFL